MRMFQPALLAIVLATAPAVVGKQAPDAVARVLDDFHVAAATAAGERYFGHFAADAVFLGTDATERWTLEQFREYADPHFAAGRGWAYEPTERHVMFSADGALAWFDERLRNDKYGVLRGTGVLRLTDSGWKIVHYSLTLLVPNDAASAVVAVIRGEKTDPDD